MTLRLVLLLVDVDLVVRPRILSGGWDNVKGGDIINAVLLNDRICIRRICYWISNTYLNLLAFNSSSLSDSFWGGLADSVAILRSIKGHTTVKDLYYMELIARYPEMQKLSASVMGDRNACLITYRQLIVLIAQLLYHSIFYLNPLVRETRGQLLRLLRLRIRLL